MVREGIPDTGNVERVNSPGCPRFVSGGRRCLTKTFLSRLHLGGHPAFFLASFLVVEGGRRSSVGVRMTKNFPLRCSLFRPSTLLGGGLACARLPRESGTSETPA